MAGASDKKLAIANLQTLKELHLISLGINVLAFVCIFLFRRPSSVKPYLFLSIPAFGCQYVIEKSGRPIYGGDYGTTLIRAGQDLKQKGVTEWLFDVIYVTFICDILMMILGTNKIWWLYSVIPGFAGYKIYNLVQGGRQLLGGGAKPEVAEEEKKTETKSKRQIKLEARGQKQSQQQQPRYR